MYFFVTPKIAIRGHKHSIRKWLYFAVEIPFKVCYNSLTRKKALLQELPRGESEGLKPPTKGQFFWTK